MADREQTRRDAERDYIARTIATIRNHRDADNCWPQWANKLADEIERLDAELEQAERERDEAQRAVIEMPDRAAAAEREEQFQRMRAEQAEARLAKVPALVEALREAREEIRQSKFRYESFGPDTSPGEINVWIHSRDCALRHIDAALAAYEQEPGVQS